MRIARARRARAPQWIWESAQQTHCGKRRRNNEDAVLSRARDGLWAVADGMGGHQAGEVASQAITAALAGVRLEGPLSAQVDAVEDALLAVNDQLRLHAHARGAGTTIGSTVVTMLARDETAVALWAGDSRLYRLRDGRLEQVTRDHNPVSDLLDSGIVTEAEAIAADTNVITRAVGGQPRLFLDVAVFDVSPQDTYLLCTDGLYRDLEAHELAAGLAAETAEQAAEALLARCLEGPAHDNVSLVVVRPLCR
ncbi:MAG TPA: protein phosphatase 2C domain-containing protein [Pseudomonadales bacterium]